MKNRPEQALLNAVRQWLSLKGIAHFQVRNGGTIFRRRDGQIGYGRSLFNQRGVADLFAFHRGKTWAIELKSPEGRLSPEQSDFLDRAHKYGGVETLVARSLDEVIEALEK